MGATQQFAYQYFIVPFMAGAVIALLYCLLHEGKKRLLSGILSAVCGIVVVWYFLPFHDPLPAPKYPNPPDHIRVELKYNGREQITLPQEQAQEVLALCNELVYTRLPTNQYSFTNGDAVILNIYRGSTYRYLYLALDEAGLPRWPGVRGLNGRYDQIQNPEELLSYLETILPEE